MKEVLDFIVNYWEYLSIGFVLVVNIILFLLKKKPVVVQDSLRQVILSLLPGFIAGAESTIGRGHGKEKFILVLECVNDWLKKNGFELTPELKEFVEVSIENILLTPTKKEIVNK